MMLPESSGSGKDVLVHRYEYGVCVHKGARSIRRWWTVLSKKHLQSCTPFHIYTPTDMPSCAPFVSSASSP